MYENQLNFEISNLLTKNFEEKSDKSISIKTLDTDTFQSNDKKEKIIEKELLNSKNLNKEDSFKKENETDNLNILNSKEKKIISVDLTNDEKIVYSQLGINPLIKLVKEYLAISNIVRLKDSNKETEKTLDNKKAISKKTKKISKSGEEKIQIKIEANANSEDKSTNKTHENKENNEVIFSDKKDEIELTDELNNARKKRRRSSASV